MAHIFLQPFTRAVLLILLFMVVTAITFEISRHIERRLALRRRLEESASVKTSTGGYSTLRGEANRSAWSGIINAFESRGLSLADSKAHTLRRRLIAAGYAAPEAPQLFTLIRLTLTLGLPAIFVVTTFVRGEDISIFKLYLTSAILALFGLYIPNLFITARADRRREELVRGFPDALDLMLVCVEAGLGLEAAFDRVGREMVLSQPRVADLLGGVVLELRAGRAREEALRRMADRAEVDEIRSFATLLIQSDKLGSSIGQTLRVYAAEMREKRRLRAEEKAHRLPVLLSIPLVTCMLPVMIGVLMLPAAIRVVHILIPAMSR
jgi:tight adherence protein C